MEFVEGNLGVGQACGNPLGEGLGHVGADFGDGLGIAAVGAPQSMMSGRDANPRDEPKAGLRNEPNLILCFQQEVKNERQSTARSRRRLPGTLNHTPGTIVPPQADETPSMTDRRPPGSY
jgi:hypothetical protein